MADIERGMGYIVYIIGGICLALVACKLLGLPL
jgi:hypothetical protein